MFEGKKRRLLLVDDQEPVRLALAKTFERAGWSVKACSDGETALEALDRESFDAALVDNNLPGISGNEVVRRIRLPGDDTPVVRISNSPPEKGVDLEHLGIAAYLVKPLDANLVLKVVGEVVDRKRGETAGVVARVHTGPGVSVTLEAEDAVSVRGALRPVTHVADYLERRRSLEEAQFLAAHADPVFVLEPSDDVDEALHESRPRATEPNRRTRFDTAPRLLAADLHRRVQYIAEHSEVLSVRKRAANFYGQKITIGRASNNDVVLRHPSVAPFHAWVRRVDERTIALVAGGSGEPTTAEWKPLPAAHAVVLQDGMEIGFGEVRARYHDAAGFWGFLGTFLLPGMKS